MTDLYRYVLAFHVIAIISWMAGILYLIRLLVYATEQGRDNQSVFQLLSIMMFRLYRYITMPAMGMAWIAGLTMLYIRPVLFMMPWFHVKFLAVLLMTVVTLVAGRYTKRYRLTLQPLLTSKQMRLLNEAPTLLMIVIVIMVIVKPAF